MVRTPARAIIYIEELGRFDWQPVQQMDNTGVMIRIITTHVPSIDSPTTRGTGYGHIVVEKIRDEAPYKPLVGPVSRTHATLRQDCKRR